MYHNLSGRVGASRVGSRDVRNLADGVGSDQQVFKSYGSSCVRPVGFEISLAGSGRVTQARPDPQELTRPVKARAGFAAAYTGLFRVPCCTGFPFGMDCLGGGVESRKRGT